MASKYVLAEETCRALILRIARYDNGKNARLYFCFAQEEKGLKLPGGRPEEVDESRLECVIREVLQETGISLEGKKPLVSREGMYFSEEEKGQSNHNTSVLVFVANEYESDDCGQEDEDVFAPVWIPGRRLPLGEELPQNARLHPRTKFYIHKILSDEDFRDAIKDKKIKYSEIDRIKSDIERSFDKN